MCLLLPLFLSARTSPAARCHFVLLMQVSDVLLVIYAIKAIEAAGGRAWCWRFVGFASNGAGCRQAPQEDAMPALLFQPLTTTSGIITAQACLCVYAPLGTGGCGRGAVRRSLRRSVGRSVGKQGAALGGRPHSSPSPLGIAAAASSGAEHAAGSPLRPMGAQKESDPRLVARAPGFACTTLLFALALVGSATYLATCQRGEAKRSQGGSASRAAREPLARQT